MSKTTQFAFTNTAEGAASVSKVTLGLLSNYAITADTADQAVLNNKTAPIDAQEILSYRSRNVAQVNHSLNIQNPAKVRSGIQYGVQLEATAVTTDTDDATFRVDEPIVVSLTIRHPKSGNITNALVGEAVKRTISACMRDDGSWRFDDLMRSSERPVVE
jgi:hypothetical protein